MVIPIGDRNPTRRRAVITYVLIAINVVAFLLQPTAGTCQQAAFLFEWAAIPRELLSFEQLPRDTIAGLIGDCASQVDPKLVLVSAFSAMFLHANWAHLIGNMLFLWVFGNNVEDRLGPARFLLFYVVGGLTGTYVFAFLQPDGVAPLLGASGAIAAVLGAYLLLYPGATVFAYVPFPLYVLAWLLPGIRVTGFFLLFAIVAMPAWVVLGAWFALQLVASGAPAAGSGVAYGAHIGGFVAGMLLVLLLDRRRRTHHQPPLRPVPDEEVWG